MRQRFISFLPVISVVLLYAAMTAYAVVRIVQLNDGLFSYGFDDAYIHLTLSRNLALHGVWGLTPDTFSWSISSFTWPFLEAALILVQPAWTLVVPLILNIVCSVALLVLVDRLMFREGWSWIRRLIAGLLLLFVLPLVNQTTMGMEHLLHAVVAIAFFATFPRIFAPDPPSFKDEFLFLLLGMLTVATRFEGGFMIAMSTLMLFLLKRWRLGIMIAVVGLLPIVIGGIIGSAHGWSFLPNSVHLKSITTRLQEKPGLQFLIDYRRAVFYAFIPFFTLVLAYLRIRSLTASDRPSFVKRIITGLKTPSPRLAELVIFFGMVVAHMIFGRIGQLQRYEVYFVAIAIFLFMRTPTPQLQRILKASRRNLIVGALVVVFLLEMLWIGSWRAGLFPNSIKASNDVYSQHVQVARFLERYFPDEKVLAHDIGVPFYYGVHIIDFFGLGNYQAGKWRYENVPRPEVVERLIGLEHPELCVAYPSILEFDHTKWKYGGRIWDPDNRLTLEDSFYFWAVDSTYKDTLRHALQDFRDEVTPGVVIEIAGEEGVSPPGKGYNRK